MILRMVAGVAVWSVLLAVSIAVPPAAPAAFAAGAGAAGGITLVGVIHDARTR